MIKRLSGETGLIMPVVIMIIAVGTLVVFTMLQRTATIAGAGADDIDTLAAMYAADAGINTVISSLTKPADPMPTLSTTTVAIGEYGAAIKVVRVAATSTPTYAYVDAQVDALSPGQTDTFTLLHVRPGSRIRVNWALAGDMDWKIELYRGDGLGGILIKTQADSIGPGSLIADSLPDGGAYTVVFTNTGTSPIVPGPFARGGEQATWVYVQSGIDYVVTSLVNNVAVTAYLRQMPGPTTPQTRQRVYTESWKPYAD